MKKSSKQWKKGVRVVGFAPREKGSSDDSDEDVALKEFLEGAYSGNSGCVSRKKEKDSSLVPAASLLPSEDSELRKELIRLGVISADEEVTKVQQVKPKKEPRKNWLSLPDVVVFQIFVSLSPRDVVWGVELTCREWKRLSSSDLLWEALHRRLFGGNKPEKKGAGKGRVGDELGWRDHCLRSARFYTYLRSQAGVDDILRWCCACGHFSLFSQMIREGEVTKEMLNGEATSNASNSPSSNKPRREAARSDMGGAMSKQKGMSPIHLASMCGNVGITEMLAQRGVDVNRPDSKGVTPLSIAAKMGHLSVVEVLLRYGAVGDDISKLLDKHQGATRKRKGKGKGGEALPLLHSAVAGGHTQIVDKLLERAAERGDVSAAASAVDKNSRTPLHWAAEGGHVALLELLLRRGAPIETRASDFCTPLHLAVGKNRVEAARFLLDHKASVTPFLDESQNAAAKGTEGEKSPLQIACERGFFDMAKVLLEYGAEINMRSKGKGRTILHFAVTGGEGSLGLASYVVEKGADVNWVDKKGSMPIHRLCSHPAQKEAKQMLELLIRHNGNVDARGRENKTPLEVLLSRWMRDSNASKEGRKGRHNNLHHPEGIKELAETLLRHGATPNEQLMAASGLWASNDNEKES